MDIISNVFVFLMTAIDLLIGLYCIRLGLLDEDKDTRIGSAILGGLLFVSAIVIWVLFLKTL